MPSEEPPRQLPRMDNAGSSVSGNNSSETVRKGSIGPKLGPHKATKRVQGALFRYWRPAIRRVQLPTQSLFGQFHSSTPVNEGREAMRRAGATTLRPYTMPAVFRLLLLFGEPLDITRKVYTNKGLVSYDPGIVSRTNHIHVPRPYLLLGAVVHDHLHATRDRVPGMLNRGVPRLLVLPRESPAAHPHHQCPGEVQPGDKASDDEGGENLPQQRGLSALGHSVGGRAVRGMANGSALPGHGGVERTPLEEAGGKGGGANGTVVESSWGKLQNIRDLTLLTMTANSKDVNKYMEAIQGKLS